MLKVLVFVVALVAVDCKDAAKRWQNDDLQLVGDKPEVSVKFKMVDAPRYRRAAELELYTSNPLMERESNVIPNPVALSTNTTVPPLELFTSPPIPVEANVIPAVVPLQSQSDKPDTSSIMNLYTSAPLPPRANTNPPGVDKPTTASTVPVKTKPPTKKPSTKKTIQPIDTRPIVFEDSLPTTTTESDQIYFPDKVPGQPELDSKLNALSVVEPHTTTRSPLEKLLPNRHTCGFQKKTKRFANPSIAGLDEFPWVVLLRYVDDENRDAGFRCSGTLISDRYVLTAGHCLTTSSLCVDSVRLGEWKVSSAYDCFFYRGKTECADRVMDVKVARKIPHEHYDDYVRPICLPIRNLREPPLGTSFTTSGWGTTPFGYQMDIKSNINFPVIHMDYCKEYQYFKEQTCIGYSKRNDFGKMDPGGPVMALDITDKPQWYLEGVIARGYGCNLLSYPGAYSRVTYYVDWLIKTILSDASR